MFTLVLIYYISYYLFIIFLFCLNFLIFGIFFVIVAFIFNKIIVNNIELFSFVPNIFKYSLVGFEVFFLVLSLHFFGRLFDKKFISRTIFVTSFIGFVLAVNGVIYSIINLYLNFHVQYEKESEHIISNIDNEQLNFYGLNKFKIYQLDNLLGTYSFGLFNESAGNGYNYNISYYSGTDFKIDVKSIINGGTQQDAIEYFSGLNQLQLEINGNDIFIKNDSLISKTLPNNFLRRQITFYIPTGVKFTIVN